MIPSCFRKNGLFHPNDQNLCEYRLEEFGQILHKVSWRGRRKTSKTFGLLFFCRNLLGVLTCHLHVAGGDRERCGWHVSLDLHAWMARWGGCSTSLRNLSQHIGQNRPTHVTKPKLNSPYNRARCHLNQTLQQSSMPCVIMTHVTSPRDRDFTYRPPAEEHSAKIGAQGY